MVANLNNPVSVLEHSDRKIKQQTELFTCPCMDLTHMQNAPTGVTH